LPPQRRGGPPQEVSAAEKTWLNPSEASGGRPHYDEGG
jgi:hypothetical protein